MYGSVTRITLRPDKHQEIFSVPILVDFIYKLAGTLGRLAVDFHDHIARLDTRFFGWTCRANILDDDTVNLVWHIGLLARFRC